MSMSVCVTVGAGGSLLCHSAFSSSRMTSVVDTFYVDIQEAGLNERLTTSSDLNTVLTSTITSPSTGRQCKLVLDSTRFLHVLPVKNLMLFRAC